MKLRLVPSFRLSVVRTTATVAVRSSRMPYWACRGAAFRDVPCLPLGRPFVGLPSCPLRLVSIQARRPVLQAQPAVRGEFKSISICFLCQALAQTILSAVVFAWERVQSEAARAWSTISTANVSRHREPQRPREPQRAVSWVLNVGAREPLRSAYSARNRVGIQIPKSTASTFHVARHCSMLACWLVESREKQAAVSRGDRAPRPFSRLVEIDAVLGLGPAMTAPKKPEASMGSRSSMGSGLRKSRDSSSPVPHPEVPRGDPCG